MYDEHPNRAPGITPGWQQRREGLQVYFCCCPFALLLAPFLIVARLARFGTQRLLGRPAVSPWAGVQDYPSCSER